MVKPAIFHHFGVPDSTKYENAKCVEGAGVCVTDPERHPYRVEFLRFEANSPMPEEIKKTPHAAFTVPDLDAALKGRKVILPKTDLGELFIAFIKDGEAVIELMQLKAQS
jgi:hypothetical protein